MKTTVRIGKCFLAAGTIFFLLAGFGPGPGPQLVGKWEVQSAKIFDAGAANIPPERQEVYQAGLRRYEQNITGTVFHFMSSGSYAMLMGGQLVKSGTYDVLEADRQVVLTATDGQVTILRYPEIPLTGPSITLQMALAQSGPQSSYIELNLKRMGE